MCDHHHLNRATQPRFGSALEHGEAHTEDHRAWSRRDFLSGVGAVGAGALVLGATPVQAYGYSSLLSRLDVANSNRILVLIQLKGGNDGLNTFVPYNDDNYYNARPALAISKTDAQALDLNGNLGMHPSMASLESVYGDGQMAIIQNVGYDDQTLSHFRSTDIWQTGTAASVVEGTGWTGRYLDQSNPGFVENPPDRPLGVLIGGGIVPVFRGMTADMGMQMNNTKHLDKLIDGELYNSTNVPATLYGEEMSFVRTISNNAFRYGEAVRDAFNGTSNDATYPGGQGKLSTNLSTVARLIKGGLGARIYHVSLQGFDTHANQLGSHAELLQTVSASVAAFLEDLAVNSGGMEVLTMTYSEFGRRVAENGSKGTDHGAAAPVMIFGSGINGGIYGNMPVLNAGTNVPHDTDFRSVYGSVLQDWFGFSPSNVQSALLGYQYQNLGFVTSPSTVAVDDPASSPASGLELDQNHPNPFHASTTIGFRVRSADHVTVDVFDMRGRKVQTLADQVMQPGHHELSFEPGRLPSGTYMYRIRTAQGAMQTRKMTVVQ